MDKLKSIKELIAIQKNIFEERKHEKKIKILVHMGTCCIAAGSLNILNTMKSEVEALSLNSEIEVVPSGCIGLCYAEPTVCVSHPDGKYEVYGNIDSQQGRIIVNRCRTQSPIVGVNELHPDWEVVTISEGE